jgi:hypothetical protein
MKVQMTDYLKVMQLYDLIPGDDFFEDIKKDYCDYTGGNFHGKNIEFQYELDNLEIEDLGDEYAYYGPKSREELKEELELRGFKTELK